MREGYAEGGLQNKTHVNAFLIKICASLRFVVRIVMNWTIDFSFISISLKEMTLRLSVEVCDRSSVVESGVIGVVRVYPLIVIKAEECNP